MAAAQLKLEVTCSICMNIFTDPATLVCGHSFCQVCITRTFDHQHDREYFCPECMQDFRRRPELKKNPKLCNIADHFHSMEPNGDQPKHVCSYCVDFHVPAVTLCLHCEAFLCDMHKQAHSKTPEHVLTDPTTSLEDRQCRVHKKILEYYCTVDNICICVHCLTSEHNGHKVSTINEFLKNTKNMEPILETLSFKKEETEAMLQSLQDHRMKIDKEGNDVTESVTAIMRDIRRQHDDLENRVLAEFSRHKEQISLSVSNRIQQLEKEKSELHKKITQIEELSRNTNPISALQTSDALFCILNDDEYDLYRGVDSPMIHDVGDLEKDVVFETLYSGLSNIVKGLGKDVCVEDVQNSSLFGDNVYLGKRNGSNEAKTPEYNSNAQVQSHIAKPQNVPLISANKRKAVEMLLDVETACNYLYISDDLKTVYRSEVYLGHLETLKRFQSPHVLSTRGISSGEHEIDVEICKTEEFIGDFLFIGMCYPTIDRRGSESLIENINTLWGFKVKAGTFILYQNRQCKGLGKVASQRIKLKLNYKAGQLSFYELCEPIKHLHTCTATFTQPLHLIISLQGNFWVKILT